jgi:hypothetical protein
MLFFLSCYIFSSPKIAVSVIGYNRVDYFSETIRCIESCYESNNLDFYFFLDGGDNSKKNELEKIVKDSQIHKKTIIKRPKNYGLHANILDSRKFLFENLEYEYVIELEDDMKFTPQFFKLLISLNNWAKKNFNDVYGVKLFSFCRLSKSEKIAKLNHVFKDAGHRGMMHSKEGWFKNKKYYDYYLAYAYEKKFPDLNWFIKIFEDRNYKIQDEYNYCKILNLLKKNSWPLGQAGLTLILNLTSGGLMISSVVNRLIDIGVIGDNMHKKIFDLLYKNISLDSFEIDNQLNEFLMIDNYLEV